VHLNLLQTASIVAIVQALLMAFFFLRNPKGRNLSNTILAAMLIIFALQTACSLIINSGFLFYNPQYRKPMFAVSQSVFLIGPLLYAYVRSLLDPRFRLHPKHALHAVPFLAASAYALFLFFSFNRISYWGYPGRFFVSAAVLLQNLAYFYALFRTLNAYGLTWKSFLSYIDNSKLAWVRFFIAGYIVIWIVQFQLFVGWDVLKKPQWCPYGHSLYFAAVFLFFNAMVYLGLKKPTLFSQSRKYMDSTLKESDKVRMRKRLAGLMEEQKAFTNPDLTLPELAQTLGIAPCHLSQIINESYRQNFRDFINQYRIEESKRRLQQGSKSGVLETAFAVGFNSKSAFNSAFRKFTGVTPKEFKVKAVPSSKFQVPRINQDKNAP
jgi:AraC-like DNA-binding protein